MIHIKNKLDQAEHNYKVLEKQKNEFRKLGVINAKLEKKFNIAYARFATIAVQACIQGLV